MHLTAHEHARLLVAAAADLARRRLARGSRLGATEATALIIDEIHEMAWDGLDLEVVVERARTVVSADQVLPGVPAMVRQVLVDALFPSGTYLVEVVDPIDEPAPVAQAAANGRELNAGKPRRKVVVCNTSEWTVRVTSHADFAMANNALVHDREETSGWRLDIPAGSSIAWLPGETKVVTLVPMRLSAEGHDA